MCRPINPECKNEMRKRGWDLVMREICTIFATPFTERLYTGVDRF